MKKSYIVIFVVILFIFLVPTIGNKLIEDELSKKINILKSSGLVIKVENTTVEYLSTKKHYEFDVKDSKKFLNYLGIDSKKVSFNGLLIGLDLVYSNLPFISSLELDIYLLSLPTNLENYLKRFKSNLYNKLDEFLLDKKLLSHIKYDLYSKSFNGKLKDIEENFTLKDGTAISAILKTVIFNGTISHKVDFEMGRFLLLLSDKGGEFEFNIEKLNSLYNLKAKNYFNSTTDVDMVKFRFNNETKKEVSINFSNIKSSLSLDENNNSLEIKTKNSLDKLVVKSDKLNAKLEEFNYELFVKNIDKLKYEKMALVISQIDVNGNNYQKQVEDSLWEFISSGISINLTDTSFKSLVIGKDDLKGLVISTKIDIKKDNDFRYKLNHNKLELLKNIDIKSNIKISKPLFNIIAQKNRLLLFTRQYVKEQNGSLVYDISFIDNSLKVNGKVF